MLRTALILLLALGGLVACSSSEPAPPPPRLGNDNPPPTIRVPDGGSTTDGGSTSESDGGTSDACLEVDGGPADANRLFLTYGDLALDFELGLVLAEWVPASCDATPQLRVTLALPESACTASGPNRLVMVFDDPGELPNATSSTVSLVDEAPAIQVRYADSGDAARDAATFGNCVGSAGTITYEAMDAEAGLKAALFDFDLTRCDGEVGVVLGATGAFELFVPTAWRDVCTP